MVNACDKCERPLSDPKEALCGRCADAEWDRWLERHMDIGKDD